jgi:hypothetical protein
MRQVWGTYKLVTWLAAVLALVCLGLGGKEPHAQGQNSPARLTFSPVAPADLPSPGSGLPFSALELSDQQPCLRGFPPGDSGPDDEARLLPINLGTALRLATTNHLDIAQAREVVNQAQVQFEKARILILPSLNIGSTYVAHDGNIQKTEGNIIKANRDSLFVGGGPSLAFGFADALFAPLVAQQTQAATQAGLVRVQSNSLLAVADAYFAVLRARRRLARVEATLEFLVSEQASPVRAGSKGMLPVVEAMQQVGAAEALKAEVHRVQVEVLRRREERTAARQDLLVAITELARLLRLDPSLPLWPLEDFRVPLELPEPGDDQPVEALVRLALDNRPELAENQALVRAAGERIRTAQWRPWLPNLVLNYNWGDFGGGPDLNPPIVTSATKTSPAKVTAQPGFGPARQLHHVAPRDDFDVTLLWRLQNLGLGNLAEVREQESLTRQIRLHQVQLQDRVAAEVVQTLELVKGWKERVAVTRSALFDPAGKPTGPVFEAIRLNFERVREVKMARPLEVLDSIRGLNDLLDAYGQAVTDYERARFRLMIVLGLSPEDIIGWVVDPSGSGCGP